MSTAEYKQLDTVISSVGTEADTPDQQGNLHYSIDSLNSIVS